MAAGRISDLPWLVVWYLQAQHHKTWRLANDFCILATQAQLLQRQQDGLCRYGSRLTGPAPWLARAQP